MGQTSPGAGHRYDVNFTVFPIADPRDADPNTHVSLGPDVTRLEQPKVRTRERGQGVASRSSHCAPEQP